MTRMTRPAIGEGGPELLRGMQKLAYVYDMATDADRLVTQDDVDRMQRTCHAFGELQKRLKFYVAEVRNGLILPGRAITDIELAIKDADDTATSYDLAAKIETGTRNVLVIER